MPEIIEAQILVDGLQELVGDTITKVDKLAESNILKDESKLIPQLEGSTVVHVFRQGKKPCMVLYKDGYFILEVFLSMSGALMIDHKHKQSRVSLSLESGKILYYIDARKWGRLRSWTPDKFYKKYKDNSVDALDYSAEDIYSRLARVKDKSKSIKNILMDQSIILGLGNVYAQEAIFKSRIHPRTLLSDIPSLILVELSHNIKEILELSYTLGGLSLKDYVHVDGTLGTMFEETYVYRKKSCSECGTQISKIQQGGRSTYFCPECQIL
ncbi:formamidopyrimidine-DNA glycosylase [Listeria phage LIS04]|nr:formamidopyrimidine-DNA glycosylase [Listeria phage LIS04]